MNNDGSNYQSTSYLINHTRNLSNKLEHTITIREELVDALKQHGCSNCIAILRDIVRKHNHPEGGPPTDSNRLTEVIDNAKIGREII
jgi:hypothetical protein